MTLINRLRAVMDQVDSMQEQMENVKEILNNQKEISEIKNKTIQKTATEMN